MFLISARAEIFLFSMRVEVFMEPNKSPTRAEFQLVYM